MAILINKDLQVMGGVPLDQLYLRIGYTVDLSGTQLVAIAFPFYSKDSFKSDQNRNVLNVDGLELNYRISYDASTNGDPLLYIHNYIKEDLTTDITRVEVVRDPSTGEVVYNQEPVMDPSTGLQMVDASTGELLWGNGDASTMIIITKPKFAMDSSVSFVDLD